MTDTPDPVRDLARELCRQRGVDPDLQCFIGILPRVPLGDGIYEVHQMPPTSQIHPAWTLLMSTARAAYETARRLDQLAAVASKPKVTK